MNWIVVQHSVQERLPGQVFPNNQQGHHKLTTAEDYFWLKDEQTKCCHQDLKYMQCPWVVTGDKKGEDCAHPTILCRKY